MTLLHGFITPSVPLCSGILCERMFWFSWFFFHSTFELTHLALHWYDAQPSSINLNMSCVNTADLNSTYTGLGAVAMRFINWHLKPHSPNHLKRFFIATNSKILEALLFTDRSSFVEVVINNVLHCRLIGQTRFYLL